MNATSKTFMANVETWKFRLGEPVTKTKGSGWSGCVVGFYSTDLTPKGYAVESEFHKGSVQIYPESALMLRAVTLIRSSM